MHMYLEKIKKQITYSLFMGNFYFQNRLFAVYKTGHFAKYL